MFFVLVALVLAGCGAKTGLGAGERPGSDAGREPWMPPDPHRTLSMAWSHACAIDGGEVLCWGDNSLGLVADGAPLHAPPTRVEGLPVIVEVAVGQLVSCALDGEGQVWCWGTSTGSARPIRIDALPPADRVLAGSGTVCVITAARTVSCTGIVPFYSAGGCAVPAARPDFGSAIAVDIADAVDLAIGQRHACAVRGDRSVVCWGCNDGGTLGRTDIPGTADPVPVDGVAAMRIAAETGATCATAESGEVTCWGDGSQFGLSVTTMTVPPRPVTFGVRPSDVDVGVISSCAIGGDHVGCQGFLVFGDCTDRRAANQLADIPDVREVSIGYEDMCARDASGTVHCWGCNSSGAVGDGTTTPRARPLALRW